MAPPDPPIGILMLDTRFPRVPGDIGNPESFPFPVRYRTVSGATAPRVVSDRAEGLLPAFVTAGRALAAEGCVALTTSCGFMALHQRRLAEALPVPVASSALMLLPLIDATLPAGRRAGVLTASAEALTPDHLAAVGARPGTPVAGLDPAGRLAHTLLEDRPDLDAAAAEAETVAAALRLAAAGDVGAILLECTNLPPYAAAVRRATGLPVWSILDLVRLLRAGLLRAKPFSEAPRQPRPPTPRSPPPPSSGGRSR